MRSVDGIEGVFPFVSIVVPVFNGEKTIRKCITSLLGQNYPKDKFEILLIDNNSTDRTAEIASQFPVKIFFEKEVQSSYAARNLGIKYSKGQIIAFTDATCRADKNWLKNLLLDFNRPEIGCVGGPLVSEKPSNFIQEFCHDLGTHKVKKILQTESQFFAGGNVAIKREAFEKLGLFDQSFVSGGDVEFSYRIHLDGRFKVRLQENAKVYYSYRSSLRELLQQAYKYGKGIARFRKKYRSNLPPYSLCFLPNVIELLRIFFGFFIAPWAMYQYHRRGLEIKKVIPYPFIDKLRFLCFRAGVFKGLFLEKNTN